MKRLWLLGCLLACATGAPAQQRVEVQSLEQRGGTPLLQPGFWYVAEGRGARPAMLLLHGCGGPYANADARAGVLGERMREYATRLQAQGIHALVTDSLSPRGERELCTQKVGTRWVTQEHLRLDALGALQWLAAQPNVDAKRLGLMGWSNGASTVLAATNLRHAEVKRASVRASLAVLFYPGCAAELSRGYEAVAPALMLLGEDDDWTPAAPCKALAGSASGAPMQFEAYAGAVHGFDGKGAVRHRKDVPNGVNPGQGVHVGGQPQAREAALRRLDEFLRAQWP